MKKKLLIIASVGIVIFLAYNLLFTLQKGDYIPTDTIEFTTDGFIDAETLSNDHYLVAENAQFELFIDEYTSHFQVINKQTGTVWSSNPTVQDPWKNDPTKLLTTTAEEKQSSTLLLTYFDEVGSVAQIDNYRLSISHPDGILFDEGYRTFSIKYIENGFQVLYLMENIDIDYTYFPKYITEEELRAFTPEQQFVLERIAYKKFDEDINMWYITDLDYEKMTNLTGGILHEYFYGEDGTGYSQEEAIARNLEFGYETDIEKPVSFQVGVQVVLTEDGVVTTVITDSIVEPDDLKVGFISPYPFFGTAMTEETYALDITGEEDPVVHTEDLNGYIVLPDGSGAVMNFNNGKYYQRPYSKRLYGHDLGMLEKSLPEDVEQISVPLYGMVKENVPHADMARWNTAFAAIITEGDAMATINADVSGRVDSFNKVYPTFNLREVESISIGTGPNAYGLDIWTDAIVKTDFSVSYTFLEGAEANYVGIANVYKEFLEDEYGFDQVDTTTETVLTAEMIGAYDQRNFILGVPYDKVEALTTFDQAQMILDDLMSRGVTEINVLYQGVMNGGLSSGFGDRFNVERSLGGSRGYSDFIEYTTSNDIDVYPVTSIAVTSDYNKAFDRFMYNSSRIDKSLSRYYVYDVPTGLPSSETPFALYEDLYVVHPYYHEAMLGRFVSDYDYDTIAFEYLGGTVGGSYDDDFLYRQDALRIQYDLLSALDEQLTLSNPIGVNAAFSSYITDLPTETTLYAILDYQVPLLQLIYSGKVDYSTSSLNLAVDRSHEYNILKIIETGSNVKYTLSYDDSSVLKNTKFNYYYATLYTNWVNVIEQDVTLLNDLGIHEGHLVDHTRIEHNVFKVTYSNGLEIVLNYNLSPITYEGETVESLDFYVVGVE